MVEAKKPKIDFDFQDDKIRDKTLQWLKKHKIHWDNLVMRSVGNHRHDAEFKNNGWKIKLIVLKWFLKIETVFLKFGVNLV